MGLIGSREQYSKPPRAAAIVTAAKQENLALRPVAHVSERPGEGLLGIIEGQKVQITDRKSTRLNSSHGYISYAVFCLKKKKQTKATNLVYHVLPDDCNARDSSHGARVV